MTRLPHRYGFLLNMPDWFSFDSSDDAGRAVARHILASADHAIGTRGVFRIALPGGGTPPWVYAHLRTALADWNNWLIYMGDERCVPVDHVDRSSLMAVEQWLDPAGVPERNRFLTRAELGPDAAAGEYETVLRDAGPMDLVLLGIGPDGHTASLFPGRPDIGGRLAIAVHDSPKPPPERVSMTLEALHRARERVLLTGRAGKEQALDALRASAGTDHPLPAVRAMVAPSSVYEAP
ncbi:MAG: 6-phosphogluconolactonase [Gammaproteobacteria bacterium]